MTYYPCFTANYLTKGTCPLSGEKSQPSAMSAAIGIIHYNNKVGKNERLFKISNKFKNPIKFKNQRAQ
jgi:hypothetical protein